MTTLAQPPDRAAVEAGFGLALRSTGNVYLRAEAALRAGGPATAALLRDIAAQQVDEYARLVAITLAGWIDEPRDATADAMNALDELASSRRGTPSASPRPDVVELLLSEDYGARIAPHLALRLTKEPWPPWKILGVLLYLQHEHVAASAPFVARYAWTAPLPKAANLAREVVVACLGHPAADLLLKQTGEALVRSGEITRRDP